MADQQGQLIDATEVAAPFRQQIKTYIADKLGGVGPRLVGFLANNDPAAKKYADWTGRACQNDGITYELRHVDKDELEDKLREANEDPNVHGIIIYYPCFGNFPSFFGGTMDEFLRDSISVTKDVEGLCHTYRHHLYRNIRHMDTDQNLKCLLPCTPLAIVKILEHLEVYDKRLPYGNRLSGKRITVINRSDIVGRPLAAMLANDGADVYSVDIDSIFLFRRGKLVKTEENPETACRNSQVIVTGVPAKSYRLPVNWISPNTVIINVASFKNVDQEEVLKVPGVRYVPMVGKVTVSMLERNLIRLYEQFHHKN